ncbi:hypothetical protein C2L64_34100 [Paraburkholderia hospita]|uniref:Uncharacterized protein n=1 Tax=Paraburkholderia hospita TaxID=169430 RepID=A0AAN1JG58_9BURK|nr:hypothetical protein C2L64_34100 [Paraburkholderia hospita]OUL71950.1 hypothetical protein CA602_44020 [Paraburkholderia hospita]OUL76673.1 hypothetical protein CA601_40220 [Paraburkholderia hospita]
MMKIQASTSRLMIDLRTRTQTRASLTRWKSHGSQIDRFALRRGISCAASASSTCERNAAQFLGGARMQSA